MRSNQSVPGNTTSNRLVARALVPERDRGATYDRHTRGTDQRRQYSKWPTDCYASGRESFCLAHMLYPVRVFLMLEL
jgi:hypothetical protein